MLAVLEDPAIRARVTPFDIENYHRLVALGTLAPNVELLRGALVEKMPKSPLHSSIVAVLHQYLLATLPAGWHARAEQPLTFAALDSEPEPDLAVVRGSAQDYFTAHPTAAALIVEVVSSERVDRVKLGVYAEAGVPEAWLLLAEERIIERHTEPQGAAYRRVERAPFPAELPSTVIDKLHLPPATLFPR